ncbi:MAG TPA: winged helix-turn-helix transcriptional regulator [Nitrospirota bacterium]|nr:winged helix-turn-helix transcriptional regulator [Nitrospirota bacterium]
MNIERPTPAGMDQHRSLQILDELSGNNSLTQRDLSGRLGIALGLVNSYIKNLVAKGFITIKTIPPKRYAYYLTPKGFTEKTRLTYHLLQDYTRIYREARTNFNKLFLYLEKKGMQSIIFAGADEVAEIAYITLQETSLTLVSVLDDDKAGEMFFSRAIKPLKYITDLDYDIVVVTSYLNRKTIFQELINAKVDKKTIQLIFSGKNDHP